MIFDIELDDWVKYLAQDSNGAWFGYQCKPMPNPQGGGYWRAKGMQRLYARCAAPKDYTQELWEVVRE